MVKTCTGCKETLPIEGFVVCTRNKDGHGSKCRNCHALVSKQYVKNNQEKRLDSSRSYYKRNKDRHKQVVYNWRKANPDVERKIRERHRQRNPDEHIKYYQKGGLERLKKERTKRPIQYKARNKVNNSISKGIIPKASTLQCVNCGAQAREYHHYKGYDFEHWLDVVPVCSKCHRTLEKNLSRV